MSFLALSKLLFAWGRRLRRRCKQCSPEGFVSRLAARKNNSQIYKFSLAFVNFVSRRLEGGNCTQKKTRTPGERNSGTSKKAIYGLYFPYHRSHMLHVVNIYIVLPQKMPKHQCIFHTWSICVLHNYSLTRLYREVRAQKQTSVNRFGGFTWGKCFFSMALNVVEPITLLISGSAL